MSCKEFGAEILMDFCLGDLAPDEAARVEAHLAVCQDCRDSVETLRRVNEVVWATQEFQDIRVPPEVHARILEKCQEALAAVAAMREVAAVAPTTVTQRLAAERAGRRRFHPRRLVFLGIGVAAAAVFFVIAVFAFNPPEATVGAVEHASRNVVVLKPSETDGLTISDGYQVMEGDRLRTDRLAAAVRVKLTSGARVHLGGPLSAGAVPKGGGSMVRFLSGSRIEVLRGRAFVELADRSVTVVARTLAVSGAGARFDIRRVAPAGATAAATDRTQEDVLLTIAKGSVRYECGTAGGNLDAGMQLRVSGKRIVRRQVTSELFWARWLTDEECDNLPQAMLQRLIKGQLVQLGGGRVKLVYRFAGEADTTDWQQQSGSGAWDAQGAALVGSAVTGEQALVYCRARFLGDVQAAFNAAIDETTPRAAVIWRLHAERGPWQMSGFTGWISVEELSDDRPVRKLSLHHLDQTRASAPAAALTGFRFPVTVACASGTISYRVGGGAPLSSPLGDGPASGLFGLGVAGGKAAFANVEITGRLQPDWIRYELEQLGLKDLQGGAPTVAAARP